ncbi:uncharacterized protein F5891DRAFT_979398 [Suillus fuscotomentosus]|uniref:Uncharacterized protein n=1 Tax=Suillus fuscotomentosus TaxID=1912939 RepID=A0AAD4HNC6_9AGAM|nr:uncharacterized protein F5891DRAFT_979398 [Suillus fuscotomentosus]KAG1901574.1 hypothetical protein F5891DRAFT_979398 [Suillus fuscotomentosus]
MDKMKAWESDGASGIFQDELGNMLVAYFTRRAHGNVEIIEGIYTVHSRTADPINNGMIFSMSEQCLERGKKLYFDGIKRQTLEKVIVSTQLLVHHLGVQHAICDSHHNGGDILMKYAKDSVSSGETFFVWQEVDYVYEDDSFALESTGVLHLMHGWAEQGHAAGMHGIHLSKNMVSGLRGIPHIYVYYKATETLVLQLSAMFCVNFPEFYKKYQKAFKAGKWIVVDPGPFLGRVIVWKLAVLPYQDVLDAGPAVIFPMGRFKGGEYRPGEVIILMASVLYHGIGDWTPEPGVSGDGITPGWIDKPIGWSLKEAGDYKS